MQRLVKVLMTVIYIRCSYRADVHKGNIVVSAVCDAGEEDVDGVCTACEKGYYKEDESNAPCDQCDAGKTTDTTGTVPPDDCFCKSQTVRFPGVASIVDLFMCCP